MKNKNLSLSILALSLLAIGLTGLPSKIMLRISPPDYVPTGYIVTQDRIKSSSDGKTIYTTSMEKGDKKINIVKQLNTPFDMATCNGLKKTILNLQICYYQREGSDPQFKNIIYNREGNYYAIRTNDELSNNDLATIISHL